MATFATATNAISYQIPPTSRGNATPTVTAENGTVAVAPHAAYTTFATPGNVENNAACDAVRDCLLSAGWTLGLPIEAVGGVAGPLGWGYTGFQSHAVFIAGTVFTFYNPATDPIPSGFFAGFAVWPVPTGGSNAASQANMVAAINLSPVPVIAFVADAISITLVARQPGTFGNGVVISGNGSVTVGSNTSGGGWTLKSRTQFELYGFGNTARISLTATTGAPGQPNQMVLAATVGSNTVTMPCQQSASWQMVAHDFGFTAISFAPLHSGDLYEFNGFFWADTLCLAPGSAVTFAAFVKQPANAGFIFTSGLGTSDGMTVDMWLQATHTTSGPGQHGWSLAGYHTEVGGGIADVNGFAVEQIPYVMLFVPAIGESRVCGQIWNSFLSSQVLPLLQQSTRTGTNYRAVAAQDDAPSSLLMMSGEVDGIQTPATNNPRAANPKYVVGLGATTALDPLIGILTIATGSPTASLAWVGLPITINGVAATVVAVTSPTTLTYAPLVAIAGNVPWALTLS